MSLLTATIVLFLSINTINSSKKEKKKGGVRSLLSLVCKLIYTKKTFIININSLIT